MNTTVQVPDNEWRCLTCGHRSPSVSCDCPCHRPLNAADELILNTVNTSLDEIRSSVVISHKTIAEDPEHFQAVRNAASLWREQGTL